MKKLILTTIATLGLCLSSWAANLAWTPVTSATWDLVITNWVDTNSLLSVAFAQRDNVLFDSTGLTQPSVALGNNVLSPNSVVVEVDSPNQYSLATAGTGKLTNVFSLTKRGSGTLILDADDVITNAISIEAGTLQIGNGSGRGTLGTGFPGYTGSVTNNGTLAFNRSGTLNFSNYMAGAGALRCVASGTVNIRGTNTMTGSIYHNGAVLNFLSPWTMGTPSDITIDGAANARFQIGGGIDLPSSCPVYLLNPISGTQRNILQGMEGTNSVSGQIYVGPGAPAGMAQLAGQTAGGEFNVYSSVTDLNSAPYNGGFYLRGAGSGKLYGTINLPSAGLIKTDNGIWTLYSSGNIGNGTLVAQGCVRLGANNPLPDAPLTLGQAVPSVTRAILDLGGFNQQVSVLSSVALATNIIANSSTTADSILTISGPGGAYGGFIQDSISNGTRKVGLKILSGAQQLTTNCTYSGPTTIVGGVLALGGSGSISNTPTIDIADGAALDSSTHSDQTFWLEAAQTLKGNGNFHIAGHLGSKGTIELKVSKTGGIVSNDKVTVGPNGDNGIGGQMTYGGKLKLVLSGEALNSTDTLPLFSASSYAVSALATIEPASPAPGLVWDTSTLASDGILRITGPVTGTAVLSGTDIIFSGTGGVPGGGFSVVSSTNVTYPLGTWPATQTGSFDGSGNYNITIAITPGEPRRFYTLRVP